MRIAGLGFRTDVTLAALRDALAAAGGADGLAALAAVSAKAEGAALRSLAGELGIPIIAVSADALAGIVTPTQSRRVSERFDTGSVAEAVALVAAGRDARLVSRRAVSQDRTATAAIAEGAGP